MRKSVVVIILPLVVAACSSDGGSAGPDAGGPDASPQVLLEPPPDGEGFQLGMDAPVLAGQEVTYCQYFVLPGGASDVIDAARFEHRYSEGSHHLLLFQTLLAPGDVTSDRFECGAASFTELGVRGIAYAAQDADGDLAYPQGVALRMQGGAVVLVQSHYLNTTDADLDAEVRLNVWLAAEPPTAEAGTLFFYDWAIAVPAEGTATAEMRCQVPSDVTLVYAMSHMHRRGVGYGSWLEGGDLGEPVSLYATEDWEDIDPQLFTPPLAVSAGQTIRFQCEYDNPETHTIIEGPSAEANEMCMFIAAYWPKLDPATELCAGPGSGPVFHGSTTCAETVACVQAANNEPVQTELCLLDSCERSSPEVAAFYGCVFNFCGNVCPGGAECNECVGQTCLESYAACQAATCE
jgi:hypothetical protein